MSRDPRRAAAVASAVACSILAVLASGCGLLGGSDKAEGAMLMLVDTSQSVQSEEARARYDEALETVLSAFGDGGSLDGKRMWMGVDRISANSLTESNITESELPGKNFNTNPLEHENRLDAAIEEVQRGFDNVASTPPETPGTAIVDSLENAERYFANKGDVERKYLVLLSDMFEVSSSSPGRRPDARRQRAGAGSPRGGRPDPGSSWRRGLRRRSRRHGRTRIRRSRSAR